MTETSIASPANVQLGTRSLGDLRSGAAAPWSDPDRVTAMDEAKRAVFLDLPFDAPDDTVVQIVAVREGVAVGRVDLLPARLLVHGSGGVSGEVLATSFGSGMFVPSRHRGQGIGGELARHRERLQEIRLSCGVSQMLLPIYRRLGWRDFAMPRYVLPRESRPVVERFLGRGVLAAIGSAAGDVALALPAALHRRRRAALGSRVAIERAEEFPRLWEPLLARPRAEASTERSKRVIDWMLRHRFTGDARARQSLHLLRDASDGSALGYFLLKIRHHATASHRGFSDVLLGSLQDWMLFDPARLDVRDVVTGAVAELARDGVTAIEICLPPQESPAALRRMGFLRVGEQHFLASAAPGSRLASARFDLPASWWFRPADGDCVFS